MTQPPVGLLDVLPEADRRDVLAACRRRRFLKGDIVFHDGDDGQALHVIVRGRAAVRLLGELGESVLVDIVGVGDVVGELALLGIDSSRAGTVLALEEAETMSMTKRVFDDLRSRRPDVDRLLLEIMALRIRRMNERLVEAHHVAADRRVWRRLAELGRLYGGAGSDTIDIRVTQADLADLAGTTRQTVGTVIALGKSRGILATGRGRITVGDLDGVRRAAR